MNQNKKGRLAPKAKQAKKSLSSKEGPMNPSRLAVAAAYGITRRVSSIGLSDMRDYKISYLAGYVYAGNGTLGAAQQVYFVDVPVTHTFTYLTPIAPGDASIGQAYVTDVLKHFSRKVIKRVVVNFEPLHSATSNDCTINVAPYRGGNFIPTVSTTTTSAPSTGNVLGMKGNLSFNCWERCSMDLTPYIAGGSGLKQNEFNVSASTAEESSPSAASNSLDIPCGFAVTGFNTTSGLNGDALHYVIVDLTLDLMDFIGGLTPGSVELGKNDTQWTSRGYTPMPHRHSDTPRPASSDAEPSTGGWFHTNRPPSQAPPPLKKL